MELQPFDDIFNWHKGAFRGDPRPELNEAWKNMIHGKLSAKRTSHRKVFLNSSGYNTRVPASVWMPDASPNHPLVELADGSGDHYAVLAVLHELHCLVCTRTCGLGLFHPLTIGPENYAGIFVSRRLPRYLRDVQTRPRREDWGTHRSARTRIPIISTAWLIYF